MKPTPEISTSTPSKIHIWRVKVLDRVLYTLIGCGFFAFAAGINLIIRTYLEESAHPVLLLTVISIYVLGLGATAVITFKRNLSYNLRALTLLTILFGLGVTGLVLVGLSSNGRIFLLAFVLLTAVLYDRRYSPIAITLSMAAISIVGWLFVSHFIAVPATRLANSTDPNSWVSGALTFLFVSIILTLSVTTLMQSLHNGLLTSRKEQTYMQQVEAGRQQLLQDIQRRAEQLTALHETALDITTHRDMTELLEAIVIRATHLLQVAGGNIHLVDPGGEVLTMVTIYGPGEELQGTKLKRGEGMAGQVIENGRPLIVEDYDQWPGRAAIFPYNLWGSVVSVPLLLGTQIVGVISCHERSGTSRIFGEADVRLLEQFARQAVIALENARLLVTANRRADEMDVLMRLGQAISANLDLNTILETTYHCVGELMPTEAFWIAAYEPGAPYYEHLIKLDKDIPYPTGKVDLTTGVGGHTIRTGEARVWKQPDIEKMFSHTGYGNEEWVQSILCVPLLIGNKIIGAMSAQSYQPDAYGEAELKLLRHLGQFVAIALENSRLYEESRRRTIELETVAHISIALQEVHTIDEMLPIILQKVLEAIKGSSGSIFMVDPKTAELVLQVSCPPGTYPLGIRHQPGEGITGHVAATRKLHYSGDFNHDPLLLSLQGEKEALSQVHSTVSVPLQTPEQLIGVMHLAFTEFHELKDEERGLLTAVSNVAANALFRAGVLATLEDRVRQRTQELAQANERLTELDKLKSKFIGDISHELRTPIANLNLYLDLLERGKPENKIKYLTVLREKTDWLVQFTENILNISRLDASRNNMQFTAVDFCKIVASVLDIYHSQIEAKGLRLESKLETKEAWVSGEHGQLVQVVNHLLNNAFNYTIQGEIQVALGLDEPTRQVYFQVQDTGPGISPDDLPHIFARFYRGQHIGQLNIPGYGLGLAMVKEILALHHGSVQVESTEGQGSTFTVRLPLHPGVSLLPPS